jgi:hypothetical protein
MSKYKVVWDNGKPSEEDCGNKEEVDKLLNDLMTESEMEEYAQFDVWVYQGDTDVSDRFFKKGGN